MMKLFLRKLLTSKSRLRELFWTLIVHLLSFCFSIRGKLQFSDFELTPVLTIAWKHTSAGLQPIRR